MIKHSIWSFFVFQLYNQVHDGSWFASPRLFSRTFHPLVFASQVSESFCLRVPPSSLQCPSSAQLPDWFFGDLPWCSTFYHLSLSKNILDTTENYHDQPGGIGLFPQQPVSTVRGRHSTSKSLDRAFCASFNSPFFSTRKTCRKVVLVLNCIHIALISMCIKDIRYIHVISCNKYCKLWHTPIVVTLWHTYNLYIYILQLLSISQLDMMFICICSWKIEGFWTYPEKRQGVQIHFLC